MIMLKRILLAGLLLPAISQAEVTELHANGFTVSHTVAVTTDRLSSWQQLLEISRWWNPSHSWSGQADNLYLNARLGGCFCERLPDSESGGVEHLRIIFLMPGREIRFDGVLGPLMEMAVQGRMLWKIEPTVDETGASKGSSITFTYKVYGFLDGGFDGIAPAVDGVIGEQLNRLAALLNGQ